MKESSPAKMIEMLDYALAPAGAGRGISRFDFGLASGDIFCIDSDNPDDAHLFMRALATLVRPLTGIFRFMGITKDPADYLDMLDYKRKAAYIAPDAALISNLTLRQNLLLGRYYHEDNLDIQLDSKTREVCQAFGLESKLDSRPYSMNVIEIRTAIIIREISKNPHVLIISHPENLIQGGKFNLFAELVSQQVERGSGVVFFTQDRRLIRRYARRKVMIREGRLSIGAR